MVGPVMRSGFRAELKAVQEDTILPATTMTAEVWARYSYGCSDTSRAHLLSSWGSISFGMPSMLPDSNSNGMKPGPIQSGLSGSYGRRP